MKIKIYDCPDWVSRADERGKLLYLIPNVPDILSCDVISINGGRRGICKKVYNINEECYEVWVKREINQ